jgi:hypothetical protein
MTKGKHIQITEADGTLRIAWDNRTVPKDNGILLPVLVFWMIWTVGTIAATWLLIAGSSLPLLFVVCWCLLGWLITTGIPLTFLGRFRSDWIEISPAGLVHGSEGLFAWYPSTYPFGSGLELGIGQMQVHSTTRNRMTYEGMVTLSLFWTSSLGFRRRKLLAYWLAPALKEEIFQAVRPFVEKHGLPLKLKRFSG